MTDNELKEHINDFYNYIIQNEKELKKALKKNITFDGEIFDDVYNDAIVMCVESMMKKRERVKSFKDFFFIVSKHRYYNQDNKKKKHQKTHIYDYWNGENDLIDTNYTEEKAEKVEALTKLILTELTNNSDFNNADIDLFIIYYKLKSQGVQHITYKRLAEITNRTQSSVAKAIINIRKWVNDNKKIKDAYEHIKHYS